MKMQELKKILRGMRARNERGSLELTNWIADNENAFKQLEELREYKQRVDTAAEAVIKRWDSPRWSWDIHTGVFINDLRVAIGGDKGLVS